MGQKRVILTGAVGALGRAMCHALSEAGFSVVALDRSLATERIPGVRFIECDLVNPAALAAEFCAGADAVVHTAALHGYHILQLKVDPSVVFTNNVLSTFHVASACARFSIPRLVITSSASIYDVSAAEQQRAALWLNEGAKLGPRDLYDETKVMSEQIGEYWADRGVDVTCLRTTRFFYDDDVSYNLRKLWRGADVRDVARAHLLAIQSAPRGFSVYNVAAKSPFTQQDCAALWVDPRRVMESYFPGIGEVFAQRTWALPTRVDRVVDITRAERELGFSPQHNFDGFWRSLVPADSGHQPAAGPAAHTLLLTEG